MDQPETMPLFDLNNGDTTEEDVPCFIETQFPVSKLSVESFAERTAKQSQTLTGLGKWWGRKPLILCRAVILGLLLPATKNPVMDREVFLRLMTMDDDGMLKRKSSNIKAHEIFKQLPPSEHARYFENGSTNEKARYKREISQETREQLQKRVFLSLSYNERLKYCNRPEKIDGPSSASWEVINNHLGTKATSIVELVQELGNRSFGRVPRIGDSFCGGGSIPFEAARLGCEAYGSDLNPVATLNSWAALNIIGAGQKVVEEIQAAQNEIFTLVDRQIGAWGIEHNDQGWRADAYLYCVEACDPESGWRLPLAPSWVIGEKTNTIAILVANELEQCYDINICSGVTNDEKLNAKRSGTIVNYRLVPYLGAPSTPIESLIRNLRMWTIDDIGPRAEDIFKERLFCIRWVETYYERKMEGKITRLTESEANALPDFADLLKNGRVTKKTCRHYRQVTAADLGREHQVNDLVKDRLLEWQTKGYIPSRKIDRGRDINRPTNARGWTFWHHLFNPRQLLVNGLFSKYIGEYAGSLPQRAGSLLGLGRIVDWNSKQSRWNPNAANEKGEQTFYKPSLATPLFNYCCRATTALTTSFLNTNMTYSHVSGHDIKLGDARHVDHLCDVWITDPPYADAVNYHELSEYFLAWYEKHLPTLFPDWYVDSKRAIAIKANDQKVFRESMVECYRKLSENMPTNGHQVVMFTHHDASVWADLTMILWAAGLRVTAAWCISTETDSALKQGNYVQGTVLLVLRKQRFQEIAFLDEIYPQIEQEVRKQLDSMLEMDDASEPNFSDTDYQLAAYAAALRVLTSKKIEEINVEYELTRTRTKGEISPIEQIIRNAVTIACDHLVPKGLERHLWKSLSMQERFYLKGLEIESHGECRVGVYQELARGFGLTEYTPLLASTKANQARLKNATEFGRRELSGDGFAGTLLRHIFFGIYKTAETESPREAITWFVNEIQDYAGNRPKIIEILDYISNLRKITPLEHWHKDAESAAILAGALRNRQDNV